MQEFKFLNKKKIIPGRLFEIKQKSFKKFKDAITATEGLSGLGDGELSCLLALIEGKVDMIATDDKKTRGYIENKFCKDVLIGTLGIMNIMLAETVICPAEARSMLNNMLEEGYWLENKIVDKFLDKLLLE